MWGVFKQYHYLSENVASNSKFYCGFIKNEPVAIVAINVFPHPVNKNIVKVGRIVTIPHWQGYGIGMKMVEKISEIEYNNKDIRLTTTLPIIHSYLSKSDKWRLSFQGIRSPKEAGKNAQMAKNPRECYTETFQFMNDMIDPNDKVKRTKCPANKKKER